MKKSNTACQEAMAIERRLTLGDSVDKESISRLREHIGDCEGCSADSAIIRAVVSETAPHEMSELSRARFVEDILDEFERGDLLSAGVDNKRRRIAWKTKMAAGMVATAVAALFLVWSFTDDPTQRVEAPPTEFSSSTPSRGVQPRSPNEPSRVEGNRVLVGDEPAVIELIAGIKLLAQPRAKLSFVYRGEDIFEVELNRGDLLAVVDPERQGPLFRVSTAKGTVTVTGTIFSVDSSNDVVRVTVLRGSVDVESKSHKVKVGVGQELDLGEGYVESVRPDKAQELWAKTSLLDNPPRSAQILDLADFDLHNSSAEPTRKVEEPDQLQTPEKSIDKHRLPGIEELLQTARTSRHERQWRSAADIYAQLIRLYPGSSEAVLAQVPLGNIQLDKLDRPDLALGNFNGYLASRNEFLVQEALLGKARCLGKLRRAKEERETLRAIVERFPSSLHAEAARRRLAELENEPHGE